MRILCPKCRRPGSLQAYSKGPHRKHLYYRIEHYPGNLKPRRHYLALKEALALLAADPSNQPSQQS
jgi:hypothetical protein